MGTDAADPADPVVGAAAGPDAAAPVIAPGNAEVAGAWDGPTGDRWAAHADAMDAQTADYLPRLLEAAAIRPGDRVLDVGCGLGATALAAARLAGADRVTGLDVSAGMLAGARERAAAAGLDGIRWLRADAQVADLGAGAFDRIISRNGVMFFADPAAAFGNLASSLAPDGRLALLVWRGGPADGWAGNPWFPQLRRPGPVHRVLPVPVPDAPGPFALGDGDRLRALLTTAGFTGVVLTGLSGPMYYGPDPETAEPVLLGLLAGVLAELDAADRDAAVAAVRAALRAHAGPAGVTVDSAMWLVTAGTT